MVAVVLRRSAASGRRFSIPVWVGGLPAGAIGGIGLLWDTEVFVLTSLITLACLVTRHRASSVAAWGAAYVISSGVWLFPAASGPFELAAIVLGLPVAGAIFYGTTYLLLSRLTWIPREVAFGMSFGLAEYLAALAGLSVAPVGIATIGSGAEWIIAVVGIYGTTAIMVTASAFLARAGVAGLGLAVPLCLLALLIPPVPAPKDAGPDFAAITTDPHAFDKWSLDIAASELAKMIALSRAEPGQLHIWPENAVKTTMRIETAVASIPEDVRPVLFGMTHIDPVTERFQNSAILVAQDGTVQQSSKTRLVPVTESGFFGARRGGLTSGTRATMTAADGSRFLVLLCYEVAFQIPKLAGPDSVVTIFVLAAETGFWQPVGSRLMNRHVRAREIETGIKVHRISDYGREPM